MKHENETAPPAPLGQVERGVGRLEPERDDFGSRLTPGQRARLISGGPNAGRVRREFPPPATVNRYCRAGMCLKTDAEHEPWCKRHEPPNEKGTRPA